MLGSQAMQVLAPANARPSATIFTCRNRDLRKTLKCRILSTTASAGSQDTMD
jgi:hypothetical protein